MVRTPEDIAYELWCIQEDRQIDKQPLENINSLLKTLKQRHPDLSETVTQQGLTLFLENAFGAVQTRVATNKRRLFRSP